MAYYHEEEEEGANYPNSVVPILQKHRGFGRPRYAGISHVYIGSHNQHGHGIGSFLGGLFRRVLPWLQRGARAVGKDAVRAGMNVPSDVLSKDMNFEDSLRTRARESGKNLKHKAGETIDTLMHGSGYKMGKITRVPHSMLDRVTSRISRIKATRRKKRRKEEEERKEKENDDYDDEEERETDEKKEEDIARANRRRHFCIGCIRESEKWHFYTRTRTSV